MCEIHGKKNKDLTVFVNFEMKKRTAFGYKPDAVLFFINQK